MQAIASQLPRVYTEVVKALNPFVRQRNFNRASRPNWRHFEPHRERLLSLLQPAGPVPVNTGSLCILGAGNCNDLDLPRLTAQWRRIRLADIDMEAMRSGVEHQLLSAASGPVELTACDLTGALEHLHEITHSPSSQSLARLRTALLAVPAPALIGEQFSLVASTCLLSQLTDIARHALGASHPQLASIAELIRLQHLRTMAELAAPGGRLLLLADFVSSETMPALLHAPDDALPALMDQALRTGDWFIGMNPLEIRRALLEPPFQGLWSEAPALSRPWRWNLGPRTYLVVAIECRKREASGYRRPNSR